MLILRVHFDKTFWQSKMMSSWRGHVELCKRFIHGSSHNVLCSVMSGLRKRQWGRDKNSQRKATLAGCSIVEDF